MSATVAPIGQHDRPPCSIPLADADLGLGNANWTKGLQAMSEWIWSGNLNPVAFPNHLARFFLQIPGIFEQQLNFSTSLIFDEPSFRNGIQVSGFIERPVRELVINLIGQRRRSWYTMTHHAVLGTLTARKHGIPDSVFSNKLVMLTEHATYPDIFTPVEREALKFADAFATNPKSWTDANCDALKNELRVDNARRYSADGIWMEKLVRAREAWRGAMGRGDSANAAKLALEATASTPQEMVTDVAERMINAQVVELAFLCLQFVALTGVFSGLNIPDEDFLSDVMIDVLKPEIIARLNELNNLGGSDLSPLIPPRIEVPVEKIIDGTHTVEPAQLKGSRLPLISYEIDKAQAVRDKGIAVGGVQVGSWGWSFGDYFPGGLVYLLMHHPELARFEPPYSLPLLFNEDEWRNGSQTAGFVNRRLKEIAFLRIYTLNRSRYGLEHHTMFLFNIYLDEYGVGRAPNPQFTDEEKLAAREQAIKQVENVVLYVDDVKHAPQGTYTDLELAVMAWIECFVTTPHRCHKHEPNLRKEFEEENQREVAAGTRRLDISGGIGEQAAFARLLNHQIAELAMLTGHMDGLGRAMSILHLESELPVMTGDGYLTNRPGLFQVYDFLGITPKMRTVNELRLNPVLIEGLKSKKIKSPVSGIIAEKTGEF